MNTCEGVSCTRDVDEAHTLCAQCWNARVILREELVGLWTQAHVFLRPSRAPHDFHVSVSAPSSKAPLDLHVLDLITEALGVVVHWADLARARLGVAPISDADFNARPGFAFELAIRSLERYDHTLRQGHTAVDYYIALHRIHRRLRHLIVGQHQGRVEGPCPGCDRVALIARGDHVTCLTCGATWLTSVFEMHRRSALGAVQPPGESP